MIIVTGSVIAKADQIDALIALSLKHVQRSRGEPGCVSHAVHRDVENSLRLVFVEEWESRAALMAHFAVPASRDFVASVASMVAAPPRMDIYEATALSL